MFHFSAEFCKPGAKSLINYAVSLSNFHILLAYSGNQYSTRMNARARTHKRAHTGGAVVRSGAAGSAGGGACGEGAGGEKRGRVGIIVAAGDIDAPHPHSFPTSDWYATRGPFAIR